MTCDVSQVPNDIGGILHIAPQSLIARSTPIPAFPHQGFHPLWACVSSRPTPSKKAVPWATTVKERSLAEFILSAPKGSR
jgi:hypothetical protein